MFLKIRASSSAKIVQKNLRNTSCFSFWRSCVLHPPIQYAGSRVAHQDFAASAHLLTLLEEFNIIPCPSPLLDHALSSSIPCRPFYESSPRCLAPQANETALHCTTCHFATRLLCSVSFSSSLLFSLPPSSSLFDVLVVHRVLLSSSHVVKASNITVNTVFYAIWRRPICCGLCRPVAVLRCCQSV